MASMDDDPDEPTSGAPRIGDAERDAALEALTEHFVAGRLDQAEFDQRMDAAMRARTAADLVPLFADLPQQPAVPELSVRAPVEADEQPADAGERGVWSWFRLAQGVIWPVAILSAVFFGLNWAVAIGIALIGSIVLGQINDQQAQRRQVGRRPDDPPRLPPGESPRG